MSRVMVPGSVVEGDVGVAAGRLKAAGPEAGELAASQGGEGQDEGEAAVALEVELDAAGHEQPDRSWLVATDAPAHSPRSALRRRKSVFMASVMYR